MALIRFNKLSEVISQANKLINTGTKSQLLGIARELSARAKARRTRALKAIANLPDYKIPTMYKPSKTRETWVDADFNVDKNLTIGALRYKIKILSKYLSTKTSTIKGYKQTVGEFRKRLIEGYEKQGIYVDKYDTIKSSEISDFWDIYNRVDELYNITPNVGESDVIQSYIARIVTQGRTRNMSNSDIAQMIAEDLERVELNNPNPRDLPINYLLPYGEQMDELYRIYESNKDNEEYEPLTFDEFKTRVDEGSIPNELLTSKFDI